jgi:hypothetical protein
MNELANIKKKFFFITLVAFTTVTLLELTQWLQALAAVSTRNIVRHTDKVGSFLQPACVA